MDVLGANPEKCPMVGDSVSDFEAAKAAGVPFLRYTYTPDRAVLLYQAGADIVINTFGPWLQLMEDALPPRASSVRIKRDDKADIQPMCAPYICLTDGCFFLLMEEKGCENLKI
ncbi:HAD hydrolase-like protein [Shimazuella sp. KC615]|uniref:HAD hydrolase-like protein n=1 Tax=Shimazuella alba TaxID=2690964 RepID=A0A6I4VVT7_9BACL|nr:HAD hydrolase-like protein [Shimazuella alba]